MGADLNQANKSGATPAFMAAQYGHTEALEVLRDAGADLNQTNKSGSTPAFMAAQTDHMEALEVPTFEAVQFCTFGNPDAVLKSGTVYYEITLMKMDSDSAFQIGWATPQFSHNVDQLVDSGVGDDSESFGVDGGRGKLWHKGEGSPWDYHWVLGDIIGCAIDFDQQQVHFGRNGYWVVVGFAGDGVGSLLEKGIYPCITASHCTLQVNMGDYPFMFPGPTAAFAPVCGFTNVVLIRGRRQDLVDAKQKKQLKKEKITQFMNDMHAGVIVNKLFADREKYEILMKIESKGDEELVFEFPNGACMEGLPGDSDPEIVRQNISKGASIRRATDPDPLSNGEFAGSKVLRSNLEPRDALRAFILEFVSEDGGHTQINILCDSEDRAEDLIIGFKTMIKSMQRQ